MDIIVYSTEWCGPCKMVKQYLKERGVPFKTIDVGSDQKAASDMVKLTGQMSVPVIYNGKTYVIGFSKNQLDKLIAGKEMD